MIGPITQTVSIPLRLKLPCIRVFGQQGFPSTISTRNHQLYNMSSRAASFDGVASIVATVGQDEQLESDPNPEYLDETAEFLDDYGPGKLHPIHFGDTLRGSRYKILRKLGAGAFSTVWLVRDREYEVGDFPRKCGFLMADRCQDEQIRCTQGHHSEVKHDRE